jgi:biopolymer transport protein ExbD
MKFRGRHRPDLPGFQIAPMVDVILTLLSFFLVGQIFSRWETEINVKLPTADSATNPQRLPGEVIINILADGTTVVNKQALDKDGLAAMLRKVVALFPGQPVLIRADKQTAYEHVIGVLDQCRKADLWNISFATIYPDEKPAGQ